MGIVAESFGWNAANVQTCISDDGLKTWPCLEMRGNGSSLAGIVVEMVHELFRQSVAITY